MIYTIAPTREFIPEWNDNKKSNPIGKVIIGLPSVLEIAEQAGEIKNPGIFNFMTYVKSISGFKVSEDGKIRDMTVHDIIGLPGLSDLFSEIKTEYDKLINVDKKK